MFLPFALALAPGTFGEDQPDAGRPELQAGQAIPNQIRSSLLVRDSTVKQLRSDLDDDVELANVEVTLAAKPDLQIAGTRWPDPPFFRTFDSLSDDLRQQLREAPQAPLIDRIVVSHIYEGHKEESRMAPAATISRRSGAGVDPSG